MNSPYICDENIIHNLNIKLEMSNTDGSLQEYLSEYTGKQYSWHKTRALELKQQIQMLTEQVELLKDKINES